MADMRGLRAGPIREARDLALPDNRRDISISIVSATGLLIGFAVRSATYSSTRR